MKDYLIKENRLIYFIVAICTVLCLFENSIFFSLSDILPKIIGMTAILIRLLLVAIFFFFTINRKIYAVKEIVIFLLYMATVVLSYIIGDQWLIFDAFFLSVYLSDEIDYKKVIDVYFYTFLIGTVIIIVSGAFLPEDAFDFVRENGRTRYTLGFIHPNSLGRSILVLNMLLSLKLKDLKVYGLVFIQIISALFVFLVPNSVTSAICIVLLTIFTVLTAEKPKTVLNKRMYKVYATSAMFALIAVVYFITINFAVFDDVLYSVSSTFYARFLFGQEAITEYGFNLFGHQNIPFANDIAVAKENVRYFVVDCLYVYMPLVFGIIPTLWYLYYFTVCMHKCISKSNLRLLGCYFIILIYGILESAIVSGWFNFIYVCAFCFYSGNIQQNDDFTHDLSNIRMSEEKI